MSTNSINRKPPPAPVTKRVTPPVSQQASTAFAASLKKANAVRTTRREVSANPGVADERASDSALRAASGELPVSPVGERASGGEDDQSGDGMNQIAVADSADGLDTNLLADELAPLSANDGLFEILMPDGSALGVAVNSTPRQVRFLLNSQNPVLGEKLRRHKMELEERIGRRIGKDVVLAVL